LSVRIANDVTGLGTGVATFLATPSGANLASALTTALPDTKGGTGLTALGTGVATWLGTPSGANLASALTTALPDTKGGTGLTSLGTGVATWLGTPSGANLASALTTALPETKGGTGLTALGSGVATALGTFSSANIKTACTDETGSGGALVFATSPTIDAPTLSGLPVLSGNSASTSNNAKGTAVDVNPVNVQTTDATVTTLDSFTIASNSAVVVSWLVTAIKSDSSQAAAYSVTACFRNAAGTAAQVGTSTTTIIGESDSVWDATIDNSTTTIRLRITGKAATTIQWTSILTRLTVIP
ncbi:MAG TPA: hypothetical protein VFB89_06295, partial [Gemmatimonadales bacterium]|nr:hypothetical protein [Gemmatimonadales bacterium]